MQAYLKARRFGYTWPFNMNGQILLCGHEPCFGRIMGAIQYEICGLLRLGCGLENHLAVFAHRFQPMFDICRALVCDRLDTNLRTQATCSNLRHKFLQRIVALVAKRLDPIQAVPVTAPMGLMPTSA